MTEKVVCNMFIVSEDQRKCCMGKKFGLKIMLLGFLLFSFIGITAVNKQSSFSEYAVNGEELEDIKTGRSESGESLLRVLNFNGNDLFYEPDMQTFYYSLVDGDTSVYDPSVIFETTEDSVHLAIGAESITEERISSNTAITIVAYNEDSFSQYSLKCTTLPLMNITCSEEITDDKTPIKIHLFDNRKDCTVRDTYSDGVIHLRGASTKHFPKKGYRISLTKDKKNGNTVSNKCNLLDMRNDDDWLLYAAYNDQEKIRHVFSTNLWKYSCATDNSLGLDNGMEYKYIELFINNEYYGLYALGYPIDEKQLDIKKNSDTEFLYKKVDWNSESNIAVESSEPVEGYVTKSESPNAWIPLRSYYSLINSGIASDNAVLYERIDIDNAIDIYLFYNFIQAADNVIPGAIKNMMIAAKNQNSSYKMIYAPWDMDISWGNDYEDSVMYPYAIPPSQNWFMEVGGIAPLIAANDPDIEDLIQQKYRNLRDTVWSREMINSFLDQYEDDIFDSGAYLRDMERWPDGLYEDPEVKLSVFREYVMKRLSYVDSDYGYTECKG